MCEICCVMRPLSFGSCSVMFLTDSDGQIPLFGGGPISRQFDVEPVPRCTLRFQRWLMALGQILRQLTTGSWDRQGGIGCCYVYRISVYVACVPVNFCTAPSPIEGNDFGLVLSTTGFSGVQLLSPMAQLQLRN